LQNLTIELQREQDLTLIVVTHNIEDAVFLGRKILVLDQPPHSAPLIIDNPPAGEPGYRTQPAFFEKCAQLREALEVRSHA
jgi:NitT/TauT family transport system ATP-binding protein